MNGPIVLLTTVLHNEILLQKAYAFATTGIVGQQGAYSYVNIADEYIYELYPLLGDTFAVQKPDYFSSNESIGAHITIAYPEENIVLNPNDISKKHSFTIKNLCHAILGPKEYYILTISSPSLTELRIKYGLPEKPIYKGVSIDFHITLAHHLL